MIRQIVAFVENKKGVIWQMTTILRENHIRVCGFSTVDSPEFGIVRMIVNQPDAALAKLTKAGFVVKECEVIAIAMEAQEVQRDMEAILQAVQDGNVNINYFYSSFGSSGEQPILILNAEEMDETEEMLCSHGFSCLTSCG
ncbi:MAG: hypothetical protein LUH00_13330 [Lachnospiraceae bacterium]|nr:hypothetical protein [Lachnospiraceae bacterium]